MSNKGTKKQLTNNIIWHFAEKWGCQIVNFVISIVIARLIEPKAYGVVVIVNAFISVFSIFIENGLGDSLIQKKDADNIDFCTVFYANVAFCLVVYSILYFAAPTIADYYDIPELTSLLRVAGITILVSSIKNVQHAYVSKEFIFKKFFFASLTGTIGAGIIGIVMALKGYGVWALVISSLFDTIIDTIFIWFVIDWRPRLLFSFDRFKSLYSFGWKVSLSAIITRVFNKCYHLIIGKYYSSDNLAFYDKGNNLTSRIADNIDPAINAVLFPFLTKRNDDKKRVKEIAKKSISMNFYVLCPLLMGLFIISEPLVIVLLTNKWLEAVPYIKIFCLINLFLPFQTINHSVVKAMGRSDIYLKQQTSKQVISILILIVSVKYGVFAIAIGKLISTIIGLFINTYPNKKLINYSLSEQICDAIPSITISLIMCAIVYVVSKININILLSLTIQISTGVIVYILLSYFSKNESFNYLLSSINERINKK